MTINQTNRNQAWDRNGNLVSDVPVVVDVTADAVTYDLHAKARAALVFNQAFLDNTTPTNAQTLAQVKRLTRECSGVIRLLIGLDLLDDTATDT